MISYFCLLENVKWEWWDTRCLVRWVQHFRLGGQHLDCTDPVLFFNWGAQTVCEIWHKRNKTNCWQKQYSFKVINKLILTNDKCIVWSLSSHVTKRHMKRLSPFSLCFFSFGKGRHCDDTADKTFNTQAWGAAFRSQNPH